MIFTKSTNICLLLAETTRRRLGVLNSEPVAKTLSPASIEDDQDEDIDKCPPWRVRSVSWPSTTAGTEIVVACPVGTRGLARWKCQLAATNASGKSPVSAVWEPVGMPDLSGCQSIWMSSILTDLRKSDAVVTIAVDLIQYVSANPLYGGDISGGVSAMTIIGEKLKCQLDTIPTPGQREAMVVEVAQSLVHTASSLLNVDNLAAWTDLPASRRGRALVAFMAALERTGHLLPGAISAGPEVSISSKNVCTYVITFSKSRTGTFVSSKNKVIVKTVLQNTTPVNCFPVHTYSGVRCAQRAQRSPIVCLRYTSVHVC